MVSKAGIRSWVFIHAVRGKPREMGLGPARDMSEAELGLIKRRHEDHGAIVLIRGRNQVHDPEDSSSAEARNVVFLKP